MAGQHLQVKFNEKDFFDQPEKRTFSKLQVWKFIQTFYKQVKETSNKTGVVKIGLNLTRGPDVPHADCQIKRISLDKKGFRLGVGENLRNDLFGMSSNRKCRQHTCLFDNDNGTSLYVTYEPPVSSCEKNTRIN